MAYNNTILQNNNNTFIAPVGAQNRQGGTPVLAPGLTFWANITAQNANKVTLEADGGFVFTAEKDKIVGDVGERIQFKVLESGKEGKGGFVVRQMNVSSQKQAMFMEKQVDAQNIKDLFKQSNLITDEKDFFKDNMEEQMRTWRAVAAIKQKLASGAANLSQSAVQQLLSKGISLEKISFSTLTEVMTDISVAEKKAVSPQELADAGARLDMVKQLSPGAMVMLIKNNDPLTFNNLYMANFSAAKEHAAPQTPMTEELDGELEKLFTREGIEPSEQNKDIAKFLLANDCDISKENIDKVAFFRELNQGQYDKPLSEAIAVCLQKGQNLGKMKLFELALPHSQQAMELAARYEELIKALPDFNPDAIDDLLEQQIPVTLQNLYNAHQQQGGQQTAAPVNRAASLGADFAIASVIAKRQLAEITLKLTLEAAQRLAGKNININTMPLQQALNHLRAIEAECYTQNFQFAGAEATPERLSHMRLLYANMAEMNPLTINVFGNILNRVTPFNLAGIHKDVSHAKLQENYEQFATVPNPKYGDSFAKIRQNIQGFLAKAGIDTSDQNVKAAAILSKNNMDITQDSVDKVKLIDLKIDYVQNRLHPNIAASIIRDGLNPLDMHIDELISYIDRFDNAYGENLKDKMSAHMVELFKQENIQKQERNAIIAIYRMLNAIENDGAVAVGVTVKNGVNLTMGNMLEAAKYYNRTKGKENMLSFDVDDNFGSLNKLKVPEGHISSIFSSLENGTDEKPSAHVQLHDFAFKRFVEHADPRVLAAFLAKNPHLADKTLEEAAAELQDLKESQNTASEGKLSQRLEQLAQLFQSDPTTIRWMEQNHIPATMTNINALNQLRKNPFFIGQALEKLMEDMDAESRAELEEILPDASLKTVDSTAPESLWQNLQHRLDDLKENGHSPTLSFLQQFQVVQNAIKVQNNLQATSQSAGIKIPVKLKNKVTDLNIYMVNKSPQQPNQDNRVLMALDTGHLGTVQFDVSLSGNRLSLAVHNPNDRVLAYLEKDKAKLSNMLQSLGFEVSELTFARKEPENPLDGQMAIKTDFADLSSKYEAMV